MRLLGLLAIALMAALVGGAGTAAAAPGTTTPSTPSTPTTPANPAAPHGPAMPSFPTTGIPMVDEVLNKLAGNLPGTGSADGQGGAAQAAETGQMIVVSAPKASDPTATLTAFERGADKKWKPVIGPTKADLGSLGLGEPKDNVYRTPEGVFPLDQAFGRLANPGTKMPYKQVDREDWWDSNMKSPTYNTMVRQAKSPGGDSENLYDSGPVYDYAVNIAHNPQRTPGKASAMFLHVANGQPTQGCVAIEKSLMRKVLTWLDPAKHPKIAIGVNQAAPQGDAPQSSTPQTSTPPNAAPQGATPSTPQTNGSPLPGTALPGGNVLTDLLNQLVGLIPALLGTATGR